MVKNFFEIECDGQDITGVIDLSSVEINEENIKLIKDVLEPKLIEALSNHFECDVIAVTYIGLCGSTDIPFFEINVALETDNVDRNDDEPLIITEIYLNQILAY